MTGNLPPGNPWLTSLGTYVIVTCYGALGPTEASGNPYWGKGGACDAHALRKLRFGKHFRKPICPTGSRLPQRPHLSPPVRLDSRLGSSRFACASGPQAVALPPHEAMAVKPAENFEGLPPSLNRSPWRASCGTCAHSSPQHFASCFFFLNGWFFLEMSIGPN